MTENAYFPDTVWSSLLIRDCCSHGGSALTWTEAATSVIAISYPTYYGQYKAHGFKNGTRFKNVIITIPIMYRNYALITLLNISLL